MLRYPNNKENMICSSRKQLKKLKFPAATLAPIYYWMPVRQLLSLNPGKEREEGSKQERERRIYIHTQNKGKTEMKLHRWLTYILIKLEVL